MCWRCHLTFSIRKLLFFSASWSCHVSPKCATCSKISSSKYSDKTHNNTLFSLNFASTKFRDFRNFFKIAKFNTREILDTRRLKFNTIQYNEIQAVALPLLLLLFQHVSASCLGVFFFLFDFVNQLSSTASLSLSELSSAAIRYLDCGICTLCFVMFSLFLNYLDFHWAKGCKHA